MPHDETGRCLRRRFITASSRLTTPKKIAWLTDIEQLPDMVKLQYPLVSQRVRDLIERFDPSSHTFHPVLVTMKAGVTEQRYHLEIGRRFDAVSAEHSNWTLNLIGQWTRPSSRESRLVFDATMIGGAHLWKNGGMITDDIVASDALATAAVREGITGLCLEHVEQTDERGNYTRPTLSTDRVYMVYEKNRSAADGFPVRAEIRFLDGEPEQIRLADDRRGKPMMLHLATRRGRRIEPGNVPTRAQHRQNVEGGVPDLYGYAYGNLPLTVSARLKDLIEHFEPGIHQFLPLTLFDETSNVLEERHILVLCMPLDQSSPARSILRTPGRAATAEDPHGPLVVDRKPIAGRHVWIDKYGCLFLSNDIASIIEESGWTGFSFRGYDLVG